MKIEILAVDRLRAPWARAALEEYLERIGRYCPVERKDIKRAGDDAAAVAKE
jgi:23S rRNA pseudoU1915 N3-methylase RlmH